MPRYSYGNSGGPADWAATQQARRDDQIRTILNMMMQIKNQQTEQGWKEKDYESGLANDAFNQGQSERRTRASELGAESLANKRAEEDPIIQQARILVDTGKAKDLGEAIRQLKNIKSVDEEISLDLGKQKARKAAGLDPGEKNAQFKRDSVNISSLYTRYDKDLGRILTREKTLQSTIDKHRYNPDAVAKEIAELAALTQEKEGLESWKLDLDRYRSELWTGDELSGQSRAEILAMLNKPQKPTVAPGPSFSPQDMVSFPMAGGMPQAGPAQAAPTAPAPAPAQPQARVIEKTAQRGKVRIKVYSRDGGKTWTDAEGNVVPIGK